MGQVTKKPMKVAPIRAQIVKNVNSYISSKSLEQDKKMTINSLRQKISNMMIDIEVEKYSR